MAEGWESVVAGGVVAIGGTVVGVLLDRWLRCAGKVHVRFSGWDFAFQKPNAAGELEFCNVDVAKYARMRLSVELYNNREEPTGLRNLRLLFCRSDGAVLLARVPSDETTGKSFASGMHYEEIHVVNLVPHQWTVLKLAAHYGGGEELPQLRISDSCYFSVTNHKGDERRYLVAKVQPGGIWEAAAEQ